MRGSVEDDVDGSAWADADVLVAVALVDEPADVELPDDEVAAGGVEELDELEDVELGADGCEVVELE